MSSGGSLNPLKNGAVFRLPGDRKAQSADRGLNPLKNGAVFRLMPADGFGTPPSLNPLKNGAVFRPWAAPTCATPTCLNPLKNGAVFRHLYGVDLRGAHLVSIP